jgi:hypothetical protein
MGHTVAAASSVASAITGGFRKLAAQATGMEITLDVDMWPPLIGPLRALGAMPIRLRFITCDVDRAPTSVEEVARDLFRRPVGQSCF